MKVAYLASLSIGALPRHTFLVLAQEKYVKEAPYGSAYARHSSNKFGSALA